MKLNLVVFYGSVRTERQGIRAARFIVNRAQERGHDVHFVDPLDYQLPLLDKMYKEYEPGTAPATLERLAAHIKAADAYILVSGEYNHNIPPALTNLLDHFLQEYFFRPSGIVTYSGGSFGGVRAGVSLRSLVGELGMPSISSMLPIPKVQSAFDMNGAPLDEAWNRRSEKFFKELEWYATALHEARKSGTPY